MKLRHPGWRVCAAWMAMMAPAAAEYHIVPLHELEVRDADEAWAGALERRLFAPADGWKPGVRSTAAAWLGAVTEEARNGMGVTQRDLRLAVHAPDGGVIEGFADLVTQSGEVRGFAFTLDTAKLPDAGKQALEEIRQAHYRRLAQASLPGTVWFRHLAGGHQPGRGFRNRPGDITSTFAMFSGSRAVAENLALDRELLIGDVAETDKLVAISEIQGITVRAIDWSGRIDEDNEPVVDPLAMAIPADQHALFAPSMDALLQIADWIEDEGAEVMRLSAAGNPYRNLAGRYRTQMGLDVPDAVARRFEVRGVAVTGGDPYFPSGTDVAVIFDPEKPEAFHQLLLTTIRMKALAKGAKAERTEGEGWQAESFVTEDRTFSSHVMRVGRFVAVANSPAQVTRLAAVATGGTKTLGGLEEFRFFRQRYPVDAEETAFLYLSDDAIRRWCGPELRIGASRRARAMAAMLDLTSRAQDGEATGDDYHPLLGKVTIADGQVRSETHGSPAFMTPVSELGVESASERENEAYTAWRRGYENSWPLVFDPIAVRFGISKDRSSMDMTVLPLTAGSDYEKWIELAGNSRLSPRDRAVPEKASLFISMAIDHQAPLFREFDQQLVQFLPELKVEPLGWMGGSLSIWIDEGPDFSAMTGSMMSSHVLGMLPLVVRVESKSAMKLALFLTSLRAMIEKSSPGLLKWENRNHGEQPYVVVRETGDAMVDLAVYYASLRGALLVSIDEVALLRAIERERVGLPDALPSARHAFAEISPAMLEIVRNLTRRSSPASRMQEESWAALPVLNEWKSRHPDRDPVALQCERFAADLHCPGGRGYRWNTGAMTMESVTFGHPAAPRADDPPGLPLGGYAALRAGLDFEDGGLRVRASMGPIESRLPVEISNDGELLGRAEEYFLNDPEQTLVYEYDDFAEIEPDRWERVRKTCTERLLKPEDGSPVRVLESVSGEEVWRQRYSLTDGMRLLHESAKDHAVEYQGGMLELPAELRAGAIHQATAVSRGHHDDEPFVSVHRTVIRIIGKERVEVPAGVFEDALRVEKTRQALQDDDGFSSRGTIWYAKGIGQIKAEVVMNGETDGTILMEVKP